MAILMVQKVSTTGLKPTFAAASAGGDEIPNSGRTLFYVRNGGTESITVTINSQKKCDQGFDHDLQVTVPNAEERVIGPLDVGRFNNSLNRVEVTYSGVTSVTVAALEV